jgi:hypothetical protein
MEFSSHALAIMCGSASATADKDSHIGSYRVNDGGSGANYGNAKTTRPTRGGSRRQ